MHAQLHENFGFKFIYRFNNHHVIVMASL